MRSIVTGAAGFIGSHVVDTLLSRGHHVAGVDNLHLGRLENLASARENAKFSFCMADLSVPDVFLDFAEDLAKGDPVDEVWHLAANSDIAAGITDPEVDLRSTFLTTFHVLTALKAFDIPRLIFASSSAIYGRLDDPIREDDGPFRPISNYGAMKLASEAAISAALETHLSQALIFRFPNVVGSRATHGVLFDFFRKLECNSGELEVLGDGHQEKPYLHVRELVDAMFFLREKAVRGWNCFNIAPREGATTVREIARAVVRNLNPEAKIRYTGGEQGWVGDVPRFSYDTSRVTTLGWTSSLTSDEAVDLAIRDMMMERKS